MTTFTHLVTSCCLHPSLPLTPQPSTINSTRSISGYHITNKIIMIIITTMHAYYSAASSLFSLPPSISPSLTMAPSRPPRLALQLRPQQPAREKENEKESARASERTCHLRKPAHAHTDVTLQIAACFAATAASSAACRGVGVIFRV